MSEALRFVGKIISATFSRVADKWYASITVELSEYAPQTKAENQGAVGVDLGVSALAALSHGEKSPNPKARKASRCKLQRLPGGWSLKVKGSQNPSKARMKVARLHARISAIRKDGLHQLTSSLTRRFSTIAIEDRPRYGEKGMVKNRHLARAIADIDFFEFRRQQDARWRGEQLVVVDRWFASSRTFLHGAHQLEILPLSLREWTCPRCSRRDHRDLHAASNLRNMALSFPVSVCGSIGPWLSSPESSETSLSEAESQQ